MATVSEDLIEEGTAVLAQRNTEEIQKLGDRIVSVEPDNWYGLFVRGCGYALESDFSNTVANWNRCIANIEDENTVAGLCPLMTDYLTECIMHLPAGDRLDFSQVAELLDRLNDRLPESEDEVFVNSVLDKGIETLREKAADQPLIAYFAYKALVITGFKSYVELDILMGFMKKLVEINGIVKDHADGKTASAFDNDRLYLDEMHAVMTSAVGNTPEEQLDKIEEYWLEHKTDPYVSHVLQSYQMSAAVSTAGKITSKLAKKVMLAEVQNFIKSYLGPKV